MEDLNDLALFAAVVKHKGFSAAARCLNIPKSKLSKHVARLEQQLGVRLLERSTRKLRVTEIGQAFYERCETVLASVDAARAVVEAARSEPAGVVRLGCPIGFTPMMASVLPAFRAAVDSSSPQTPDRTDPPAAQTSTSSGRQASTARRSSSQGHDE